MMQEVKYAELDDVWTEEPTPEQIADAFENPDNSAVALHFSKNRHERRRAAAMVRRRAKKDKETP